ncbi:hydroxymethylglutaryl-CoA synthase [Streptococcus lutetiensis]|uniref:hydroxymethylglutaryl-CoA synthase n=1 Tax=Streptococcus lutetiensis TaxID=150055 RepID=UPI001BDA9BD8|nr:hydroxymethylglutaryl-CoA synthase [Streptococcus lutetiensis]MBT0891764.1 hydroxymethylglutaryl-CoA synthase [Streptococcus lutetiensis]MBT0901489.1 hydroxymethylglutaryl-CoA synthase [Streptococcus lutetiensis]MBT0905937.1 hydroxymethylglutaryl-CoA synthase [Streptococcus lutetiensis]MBT0944303.1 hydroxymethylglutaryl-CoA synthase [Streptococcus lutetiensis]MBT0945073.1 hydroxymethylglutaryl-CoA synthase [Streptococcus lutetiensis]
MKIGIDKIGFATARYVLNMDDLAESHNVDPDKYSKGLLLNNLSITPINDDIVTLGASAAESILSEEDKKTIDMIIVATESSVDQSKAASTYIHSLLGIQPFARSIEMKEACYGATAALDYARLHVQKHPESKVLVIASDVARYGVNTPGEPTQGAGSVAMLISKKPRILLLNDNSVAQTRDIMDFWRPNYSTTPYVNGIYSTKQYLDMLKTTWAEFQKRFNTSLADFSAFCFHLPFPKLALKGFNKVMDKNLPEDFKEKLKENFESTILYSKEVGNIYTGSLYLGLLSLLENSKNLVAGDKIALFSYGSGAVAEIFSATLVDGFKDMLQTNRLETLKNRIRLSVEDYEKLFFEEVVIDSEGNANIPEYKTGAFTLKEIHEHQRIYGKVNDK